MIDRRTLRLVAAMAAGLVCPGPAAAQYADWFNSQWTCRRTVTVTVPTGVDADRLVGVASFLTYGNLAPGGKDLRVSVSGGRRDLPFRVLARGPGDQVTVAFRLLPNVTGYQVYFGNPQSPAPEEPLQVNAGLLLEVRDFRGGPFDSLEQVKARWSSAGRLMGADFVPGVFFGYNPFGPNQNFVAHYAGVLNLAQGGQYEFATSSTNASFLLVDDQAVTGWPGSHGPERQARHTGTVKLEAGLHRFEYYHVHTWGDPVAVAAWRPPGTQQFVAVPASAFLPVARGTAEPLRMYGVPVAPDFTYNRSEAVLTPDGLGFLQRYSFKDRTAGINRTYASAVWDFGDGITSTLWEPVHVYLADGPAKVKLSIKGPTGTGESTAELVIGRDWSRQAEPPTDTLADDYDLVRGYDFAAMPTAHLVRGAYFFERLKKYQDLVKVSRILVFDRSDVGDDALRERGDSVAEVLSRKLSDPDEARRFLDKLEARAGAIDLKAHFAVEAAQLLTDRRQLESARRGFQRVLTDYPRTDAVTRRRALVGLGDVAWLAHDGKSAADSYARADAIALFGLDAKQRAVRTGHLARVIEEMLRQNELESAEENLNTWEWERPPDRLEGYSTVLRARLLIRRSDFAGAAEHLSALVAVNPRSLYAPEALSLLADCLQAQGKFDDARAALQRILVEYPESPMVAKARQRLQTLHPEETKTPQK